MLGVGLGLTQCAVNGGEPSFVAIGPGFMNPIVNFARSSLAMMVDATGKWTFGPNNLLTQSTQIGTAPNTLNNGGTGVVPVVTLGYAAGPDGVAGAAARVQFDRGAGTTSGDYSQVRFQCASATSVGVISSAWMKTNDGTTRTISLFGVHGATTNVTVTDTWQQFFIVGSGSPVNVMRIGLFGNVDANQTADILVAYSVVEAVTYETTPRALYGTQTNGSAYYGPRFTYNTVNNQPKFWIEPTMINVALWNRDLTNAVWVSTNVTAAKDQTGLDGVTNSASSITATAANGTCLQAITHANAFRWTSAYVKRITGSGTVEMTIDNGVTWTPITLTGSWARVSIPDQTLVNPTVGFRIVTSGDAIAVDFVQVESYNSGLTSTLYAPTSPIYTTTANVVRGTDDVEIPTASSAGILDPTKGTLIFEWEAENPEGNTRYIGAISDGTSNNRVIVYYTTLLARSTITTGGVAGATTITSSGALATAAANTNQKTSISYDSTGFSVVANGGVVGTASGAGNLPASVLSHLNIGGQLSANTFGIGGKFSSVRYVPYRMSDLQMQQWTAL